MIEMMKVVFFSMVLIPMVMLIIEHVLDGGVSNPVWMTNMMNRMSFTWRHSIRSNRWNVFSTYKMAMDVYPMSSERV